MQQLLDASPDDRFVIYLNDHRGLLAAESDLAKRSHRSNAENGASGDLVTLLASIVAQNGDDRQRLDELLEAWGGRANPLKTVVARIGERFGRLKLNGQLRGYSPLSRVVELEALLAATAVRAAMWTSIGAVARDEHVVADANKRAAAISDQHARLGEHHLSATLLAFTS